MCPARTRDGLIGASRRQYARLSRTLDRIPQDQAETRLPAGLSIKDAVAHRAWRIAQFFTWIDEGALDGAPDPRADWANAARHDGFLGVRYAGQDWIDARQGLMDQHARLMQFLDEVRPEALTTPFPGGRPGTDTLAHWIEVVGPNHYATATAFVRAAVVAQGWDSASASGLSPASSRSAARNLSNASRLTGSN